MLLTTFKPLYCLMRPAISRPAAFIGAALENAAINGEKALLMMGACLRKRAMTLHRRRSDDKA